MTLRALTGYMAAVHGFETSGAAVEGFSTAL